MSNKILTFVLIVLAVFGMTSCVDSGSHINLYDTEEILNEGDSFHSSDYHINGNALELEKFSGTYTIITFDVPATLDLTLDVDVTKGNMRVLWVTAQNEIIELQAGEHHLEIFGGMNRLKIIADDVTCQVAWNFVLV